MNPLFKWPGGKTRELPYIRSRTPDFERYVEPFAGGAAVFFDLEPERAILNDVNPSLTGVYRMIQQDPLALERALLAIEQVRQQVDAWAKTIAPGLRNDYRRLGPVAGWTAGEDARQASFMDAVTVPRPWSSAGVWTLVARSLRSKLGRLHQHEQKTSWTSEDLALQLVVAAHAGWYTYLRDAYEPDTPALAAAHFLYFREFSYGAMFRFNRQGRFNIPYGGASYNDKDFAAKIQRLCDPRTIEVLRAAEVRTGSFERLSTEVRLRDSD